jgi:hypothetical protein
MVPKMNGLDAFGIGEPAIPEDFQTAVGAFKDKRQLAAAFGVAETTVERWGTGITRPHPSVIALVLAYVRESKFTP